MKKFYLFVTSWLIILSIGCGGGGTAEVSPLLPVPEAPAPEVPAPDLTPPASFRVEAEAFSLFSDTTPENKGGAGNTDVAVDLETTDDVGGGLNLAWTEAGEWLEYEIEVPHTSHYVVTARLAALASGGQFGLMIDGELKATVSVFGSGDWQRWREQTVSLGEISQGRHTLRLVINRGLFNLNYLDFAPGDVTIPMGESSVSRITAKDAVAAMGRGVNIGQVFETNNGSAREFAPVRDKIDAYYALGFRHVRVPVTWSMPIGGRALIDEDTGALDAQHPRLGVIAEVVDYALSLPDMFVIINAHHEIPIKHNNQWWVFARLWEDAAAYFADRSHRLIFELLNEPHDADGGAMLPFDLRNMSQLAYERIRLQDPYRMVVISGNQWGAAGELANTWPTLDGVGQGLDPYLMATFHHYDPWVEFHSEDTPSRDYPFTDDTLNSPMDQADRWRQRLDVDLPIYIGEWGVGWGKRQSQMDCNNIRAWYQQLPNKATAYDMPTTVWDDGGWFAIFRYETGQFVNNLAQCIVGDCEWSGDERFNAACLP
jgi:endoglucanase